jgi:hypothetical protein
VNKQTLEIQNLISFNHCGKLGAGIGCEITIRIYHERNDSRINLIKQYYSSLLSEGYVVKFFPISMVEKNNHEHKNVKLRDKYIPLEQISNFLLIPDALLEVPNVDRILSKKISPPEDLYNQSGDIRFIAQTNFRYQNIPFGIGRTDRRRHMYILGKSGSGKSTLLKNLIIGDIFAGEGLCLIDPHGDLIEDIIELIPENRISDVIYWDISDTDYPIAVNLLNWGTITDRSVLADALLAAFKRYFSDSGDQD